MPKGRQWRSYSHYTGWKRTSPTPAPSGAGMVDGSCKAASRRGRIYLGCLLGVKAGRTQAGSYKPYMTMRRHGGYALGADCPGRWGSGQGKRHIYLRGRGVYRYGIGAHSPSDFTFHLAHIRKAHGSFRTFSVSMGIDAHSGCSSTRGSTFLVYVDGRRVVHYATSHMSRSHHVRIHVPAHAKTLRLRNLDYRGRYCNHAVWANAVLLR
mmetsp:Transcript_37201/g.57716  ORF Transcript_37201/g.57716 Transcript_37201/m.57716 type:complete len:209 (+) Transcript_37201:1-627(+)